MLRISPVALAALSALGFSSSSALSQNTVALSVALADAPSLGLVTISATRTERLVDDVPAAVTVTGASAIERAGARDIKDVFRDEIDISVRSAATRFTAAGAATGRAGNEGINIRGLEGNRVLILVDGIRVPNAFSFGSFATGRGDFLNIDAAQAIEVLRGPASTQYGSDGLGGVVSLRTIEPGDVMKRGQDAGGFARIGYSSVDRSWNTTFGGAGRSGPWQGLLLLSGRQGHETGNAGSNNAPNITRTTPNPLEYSSPSLLGKVIYTLSPAHQWGLTVDTQRRSQDTEVLSARAIPPLAGTSTLDLDTRDVLERNRVSLEHRFTDPKGAWIQKAETRIYSQNAKVRQFAMEDRNVSADRARDNRYTQDVLGVSTLLESNFKGSVDQRVIYGVDLSQSDIKGVRSGTIPPFGETFPTKPFPDTRYTLAGIFVQDEIEAGTLSVIPGVRFDHYKLSPSSTGYAGGAVTTLSDQAFTPRIGVVWRLAETFSPYAQWAKGFHAPTPDQVNNGFTNLASNYRSISNPNLKAERAQSMEAGVRGRFNGLRWSAAAFDNRYHDFISQEVVGGNGTAPNPTIFQYINLASAHIRGVELRGEWQIATNWSMNAGSAYTRGTSQSNGVSKPLDTIEPQRTVIGVRYAAGPLEVNASMLHSAGKPASLINPIPTQGGTTPPYAPPASTVLNLGASWKPMPKLTLVANLNNVFDNKYWRWSDVRGLADNITTKDAYTAPGRNVQVSARYEF